MADDMRADIEAALESSAEAPEPAAAPAAPEPSAAEPAAPVDDGGTRDSLGRFVSKAKLADTPAATAPTADPSLLSGNPAAVLDTPAGAVAPAAAPAGPAAPAGWGPAVREHWGALPVPVREQVMQREQQMQRFVNDTAPARQTGEQFMQAIQPYQMAIQAEGVDPITAVTNLMQVGSTLRFGTPLEKANTVAKLVQAYGVDIVALDTALVGGTQPAGQQSGVNIQAEIQRALAPLMQAAQQRQHATEQQTAEQARNEITQFEQGKEFIQDVRSDMADLLDVASKNGRDMSLQQAYDTACMLHPEVSKVMMARRQGSTAQDLTQAAKKAKAGAVSIRGSAPVGSPDRAEPSSVRASIEAAIEAHSRV